MLLQKARPLPSKIARLVRLGVFWQQRFNSWAAQSNFWPKAEAFVIALLLILAVTGYSFLSNTSADKISRPGAVFFLDRYLTLIMLLTGALLVFLVIFVARRLSILVSNQQRGQAGARLHLRMMKWFIVMAIVPTVLVAIFASLLFERGVAFGFSDQVRQIIANSDDVAQAYVRENRERIRGDILAMARDLNDPILTLPLQEIQEIVRIQARVRGLAEAIVFKKAKNSNFLEFIARYNDRIGPSQQKLRLEDFMDASRGELVIIAGEGNESNDVVQALIRVSDKSDYFLYVNREVSAAVISQVVSTKRSIDEYQRLDDHRQYFQKWFLIILIVTAVVILFIAVLIALYSADRIVSPIGRLVRAAERVGHGDLAARVPLQRKADELGMLGRTFNKMTAQLQAQTTALLQANSQLNERRRFTEAVLSGVSAGVMGVDARNIITLPNRSAAQLLETTQETLQNRPILEVMPEITNMLADPDLRTKGHVTGEVTITRTKQPRNFAVHIVAEQRYANAPNNALAGFVVTFDDITEALANQRRAAWSDVARRIAHEIKNPLTPIQLSAERLERKYGKQIQSDKETFTACTQTIIRQVADLRRMVDEFSAFARMPKPVFGTESLTEIIQQAIFLQQIAYPDIQFTFNAQPETVTLVCDRSQFNQAFINLLKNAAEALQSQPALENEHIDITLLQKADCVNVMIQDNGAGFPLDLLDRLTEPYVSTRAKGTGLGLAIVKKIVEDHLGTLTLSNAPSGGALVKLSFNAELLKSRLEQNDDLSPLEQEYIRVLHGA
jgi:two-component system, NtrC family, nitrogen regulation sensor histidine kinase NtrY